MIDCQVRDIGPQSVNDGQDEAHAANDESRASFGLIFGGVVGLFFLYLLSAGPATYCMNKQGFLYPAEFKLLDTIYTPAGGLYPYCKPYHDYLDWCGRKGKGW